MAFNKRQAPPKPKTKPAQHFSDDPFASDAHTAWASGMSSKQMEARLKGFREFFKGRSLFLPPTRRYIPMRHKALARQLGGIQHPGLPTGIFIEIVGNAGSGKSTLCAAIADAVINQPTGEKHLVRTDKGIVKIEPPRRVLYLDFEFSLDINYITSIVRNINILQVDAKGEMLNMDSANFWIHQPTDLEEGLEVAAKLVEAGLFDLVIVDSVPAMLPQAVRERSMEQPTVGKHAASMAVFFQRLTGAIARNNCTVLLVNQWRDAIGARPFMPQRRTPGGKSMEYFDAIKIDVAGANKTPWFDAGNGKTATIRTLKNKISGIKGDMTTYTIGGGLGLSAEIELTLACIQAGYIEIGSRTRTDPVTRRKVEFEGRIANEKTYDNIDAWIAELRAKPMLFKRLTQLCEESGYTIGSHIFAADASGGDQ